VGGGFCCVGGMMVVFWDGDSKALEDEDSGGGFDCIS